MDHDRATSLPHHRPAPARRSARWHTMLALALIPVLAFLAYRPLRAWQFQRRVRDTFARVPAIGQADLGASLFQQRGCADCHPTATDTPAPEGPSLRGLHEMAGERVSGIAARDYAIYSILDPDRFLVPGWSGGMAGRWLDTLQPRDVADLAAYLLTL